MVVVDSQQGENAALRRLSSCTHGWRSAETSLESVATSRYSAGLFWRILFSHRIRAREMPRKLLQAALYSIALAWLMPAVSSLRAQQVTLGMPQIAPEGMTVVAPQPVQQLGQQPVIATDRYINLDYGNQAPCAGDFPDNYAPPWTWQAVPPGLLYRSYLAGPRESRLASVWNWSTKGGQQFWDFTLGGHVGLLRYGTVDGPRPGGFQIDVDAAAFPILDMKNNNSLIETDFRGGIPLTFAYGPWEAKFGYYHIGTLTGSGFATAFPGAVPQGYLRDDLVLGMAYRLRPSIRLYGETAYAVHRAGGARPFHFQFGAECSDLAPSGPLGAPFLAVNGHIRQDVNWSGSLSAQAGWQWRGYGPGHLLRVGVNYFNGITEQYALFNRFQQLVGVGLWYDY